jgi:hypothetical protein
VDATFAEVVMKKNMRNQPSLIPLTIVLEPTCDKRAEMLLRWAVPAADDRIGDCLGAV